MSEIEMIITSEIEMIDAIHDVLELDMEYKLTVGILMSQDDEKCARYFIERREVLLPEILRLTPSGGSTAKVFHDYARKVHVKLCEL
jgi:hypothetical protein